MIFLLVKLILSMEIVACWVLVRRTCCVRIFTVELVVCWFFSSGNSYIDFSPRETDFLMELVACWFFSHRTWCVLIFVRETYCTLIFLFVRHLHWFFSSLNFFCSWNLLRADFVHETCCVLIFLHEFLHIDFFQLWNLYKPIDFNPCQTDFVHRTWCVVIFLLGACYVLIFILET